MIRRAWWLADERLDDLIRSVMAWWGDRRRGRCPWCCQGFHRAELRHVDAHNGRAYHGDCVQRLRASRTTMTLRVVEQPDGLEVTPGPMSAAVGKIWDRAHMQASLKPGLDLLREKAGFDPRRDHDIIPGAYRWGEPRVDGDRLVIDLLAPDLKIEQTIVITAPIEIRIPESEPRKVIHPDDAIYFPDGCGGILIIDRRDADAVRAAQAALAARMVDPDATD